jgi:hypothetical protein
MLTYTRPVQHREDDDPCPPESPLDSAQAKRARLPVVITDISLKGTPEAAAVPPRR